MGSRQIGILREAIIFALEHRQDYNSDMEAIAEGLRLQETASAIGVYNKLWSLLCSDVFRESEKRFETGKLNVVTLGAYASDIQKALVEIILGILWRKVKMQGRNDNNLYIVIDEFQHLRLSEKSVVTEMLLQARKYDVNLILATQSSVFLKKNVIDAVRQTATSLYFQPSASEVKKIANLIDSQQEEKYVLLLKKLQRGQSIVTGTVELDGREMVRPFIINSEFGMKTTRTTRTNSCLRIELKK